MSKTGKEAKKKEKDIQKIAEDRTFGLKNKNNSKKVQQVVKGLAAKEKGGYDKLKDEIFNGKRKQQEAEEERRLMQEVFANAVTKKVQTSTGEDITVCKLFEAGLCNKGKKCKFSHVVRGDHIKVDKIDLFTDQRDLLFGNKDTIENWDAEKLNEVVGFNDRKYNQEGRTEKVCKAFVDAVERKIYGWNWVCPNGYNCIYKHCLPEGYELQRDKKVEKVEKYTDDDVIEEIDNQREKLKHKDLTPVSEDLFFAWLVKRKERLAKENDDKVKDDLKGMGVKSKRGATGRELFDKDKEIFKDAEDAIEEYEREDVNENGEKVEIDEGLFGDEEMPDI